MKKEYVPWDYQFTELVEKKYPDLRDVKDIQIIYDIKEAPGCEIKIPRDEQETIESEDP